MKFGNLHLELYALCPCISGSDVSEQLKANRVKSIWTLYLLQNSTGLKLQIGSKCGYLWAEM